MELIFNLLITMAVMSVGLFSLGALIFTRDGDEDLKKEGYETNGYIG